MTCDTNNSESVESVDFRDFREKRAIVFVTRILCFRLFITKQRNFILQGVAEEGKHHLEQSRPLRTVMSFA